jgi:hypothetical protein
LLLIRAPDGKKLQKYLSRLIPEEPEHKMQFPQRLANPKRISTKPRFHANVVTNSALGTGARKVDGSPASRGVSFGVQNACLGNLTQR